MKQIAKITLKSNISIVFDEYGVEIAHEASVEIVTDDEDFEKEVQAEEKCEQACEEEFAEIEPLRKLAKVFVNKCYQEMQQAA
mgnify:FL=1